MLKQEEQVVEEERTLQGQANIWKIMLSFAESMALKCAVELRIADIINSHGHPITLLEIAASLDSPSPDVDYLARVMRLLVHKRIFTSSQPIADDGCSSKEAVYGLTNSSKWLLRDSSELSLAALVLMENHPLIMAPWHYLNKCVQEGGVAFPKAHGCDLWDFAAANPELNNLFNEGLACTSKIVLKAVLSAYGEGFAGMGSGSVVVDVGGGIGMAVAEIVKTHPHIKGINFDLPHVIDTAPQYPGVSHVAGDMFASIPKADALFLKWVLHDWSDENCINILKNCRNALPEKSGKIIILEVVLEPKDEGLFAEIGLAFDLLMISHTGGKERTKIEWMKLLEEAGFPRYKIIQIPALPSIIEAYLE
ncbi:(R,S)-reticuline 7-O-methyltransferase-like [Macadamia integrifolia]|uniref:(R,S)-reticuline 7-O-methyltransferase-like n=1 Tax=Macadamia integrifolia TaxID=60698 RepID=UPI001C52CB5E|nr:(R,S)-reticuline 7-O-methyltransferase-like [Macadamia integrifolia]